MLHTLGPGDELFHTATGTAYADLQIDGHRETWPIHSKRFRSWLRRCYYQATGDALSTAALNGALNLLEAQAGAHRRLRHKSFFWPKLPLVMTVYGPISSCRVDRRHP